MPQKKGWLVYTINYAFIRKITKYQIAWEEERVLDSFTKLAQNID
jgi:hypothetical protein